MAKYGGTSAAGRKLNITQPAVSKKLSELEDLLEKELVIRKRGRFDLSETGKQLYTQIRPHFEELLILTDKNHHLVQGKLRIGLFRWVGQTALFGSMARLQEKFAGLQIELRYMDHDRIESALLQDEIDLGFLVFIHNRSKLQTQPFFDQKNQLVMSKNYQLKKGQLSSPAELEKHSFVDFDPAATAINILIQKNLEKNNPKLKNTLPVRADLVITEPNGALEAIRAGLGIGFCPLTAMDDSLICCNWPTDPILTAGIELAIKKQKYSRPGLEKALQVFAENFPQSS